MNEYFYKFGWHSHDENAQVTLSHITRFSDAEFNDMASSAITQATIDSQDEICCYQLYQVFEKSIDILVNDYGYSCLFNISQASLRVLRISNWLFWSRGLYW